MENSKLEAEVIQEQTRLAMNLQAEREGRLRRAVRELLTCIEEYKTSLPPPMRELFVAHTAESTRATWLALGD